MANVRDDDLDSGFRDDPSPSESRENARGKVAAPAIALLVWSAFCVLLCITSLTQFPKFDENWERGMAEQDAKFATKPKNEQDAWENMKKTMGAIKDPVKFASTGVAVIGLIISGITIFAMLKMRSLQSYGLAKTMAILNLIPCLMPCCVVTMPLGIWCLIVLGKSDVKRAFDASGRV